MSVCFNPGGNDPMPLVDHDTLRKDYQIITNSESDKLVSASQHIVKNYNTIK